MLVISGSVQDSIDRAALAVVLDLLRARGFLPHITIVRDDLGDPWGFHLALAPLTLRFGKDAYAEFQTHDFTGGSWPPMVDPGSN